MKRPDEYRIRHLFILNGSISFKKRTKKKKQIEYHPHFLLNRNFTFN